LSSNKTKDLYIRVDIFAINKAAERHHHKKYKDISLLLERANSHFFIFLLLK